MQANSGTILKLQLVKIQVLFVKYIWAEPKLGEFLKVLMKDI